MRLLREMLHGMNQSDWSVFSALVVVGRGMRRLPAPYPLGGPFGWTPYTGSLMPCRGQGHVLGILKAIREQAGKQLGDTISIQLWRDESDRTVEVPSDLAGLMRKHGVRDFFDALSFTNRREYCRWITEAKKVETRAARLTKSIDMMRRGIRTPG